jgi:hypothetical protein
MICVGPTLSTSFTFRVRLTLWRPDLDPLFPSFPLETALAMLSHVPCWKFALHLA